MRAPNDRYFIHGGTYILANKLQMAGDGITGPVTSKQWWLLRVVSDMEGASITRVAGEMGSTRQNIAKMLEPLARRGYVALAPSSDDRRSQTVRLTAKSRALLGEVSQKGARLIERLFAGISDEEVAVTRRTFEKLFRNLEAIKLEQEKGDT